MTTTLIVITNKTEAQLYFAKKYINHLEHIESINNEAGRMKEGELVSDTPGSSRKSSGFGMRRMTRDHAATHHVVEKHAHSVTDKIEEIHHDHPEMKIILVAEPGFQGEINKMLTKKNISIYKTISKELNSLNEKDLFEKLKEDIDNACFV